MTAGSIVHVCDFPNLGGGNFVPSQFELALRTRQKLGLGTHFVFPRESRGATWIRDMAHQGIGVSLIDRNMPRHKRAIWLRTVVAAHRASLVHSHFTHFDMECVWAARPMGAHVVWHLHTGISSYTPMQRASDVIKVRGIGRACDRVVACAPWIAEQAVDRGFPEHKVRVVPNGIVLERFDERNLPDKITARDRFGIDPDQRMVLAFCWSPVIKGADVILEASLRLADEADGSLLVVMVGGEALESYVDQRLRGERPTWLRLMPPVGDVDLPALLSAADVFVNASRQEGMSYAIAEAMAAGRPVVASEIPGSIPYLPAPGLTSFPSEDPDALLAALAEDLGRLDLVERGRLNCDFAFKHFGTNRYARQILDVYGELMDGSVPALPAA